MSCDMDNLIVVTGFGPFEGHENKNASWEAVRLLSSKIMFKDKAFTIHKKEVPVEYSVVDNVVKEIWDMNPKLVVHCGVHGSPGVHVEKLAYNNCFDRADYEGNFLEGGKAVLQNLHEKDDFITCGFNVKEIVDNVNKHFDKVHDISSSKSVASITCSNNVGSYLCCYIYIKSLDIDRNRSLFVHVPPIDKPLSSKDASEILFMIIKECLSQLEPVN